MIDLPVIDIQEYKATKDVRMCALAADTLHRYGALCIKDNRVSTSDNDRFLDMIEHYYETSDFEQDARPNLHYQVGVTPEYIERPRDHSSTVETLEKKHKPVTLCPPNLDKKSRFFWRVGPRPTTTEFKELNAEPVIPEGFPEWEDTMNMWGNKMLTALKDLAEMAGIGFGWEANTLTDIMHFGPHLLAPTGSNYNVHNQLNDVLAGFHYDLNLLTVHGKSRFPGLYIWLRDGTRTPVEIPDGCLLVQAGKQLEYLTGGYVKAGFHEVVVSENALKVMEERKAQKKSLWRVSSTLFAHSASDAVLQPLPPYSTLETRGTYPSILAGKQVLAELKHIELGS
uniref:Uncharacterized protein AlNc14C8G1040 n=1 Tax=Albugo laibachii Nc14 TaxID=890382 RepID=F0W1W1_9STRA|nr:conserved hypothetical protein [Albugo laibachii Nc14]|eukprot:CCA15040.1 conserved hypothetical protein [Albugo laibachii Nc14]